EVGAVEIGAGVAGARGEGGRHTAVDADHQGRADGVAGGAEAGDGWDGHRCGGAGDTVEGGPLRAGRGRSTDEGVVDRHRCQVGEVLVDPDLIADPRRHQVDLDTGA